MSHIEILSGRERRRFWSDEQKLSILEDAFAGAATVADVARRHDLIPQQIYTWRRQFAKRAATAMVPTAGFLPVAIVPDDCQQEAASSDCQKKPVPTRSAKIEVQCKGGRILKMEAGLDSGVLQALIRTVEAA